MEPPKKTPQGDVYKIQPLPFGVDREVLQEWADSNLWNMHPLKPLGAKTWLVNSSEAPPKDVMFFNSSPLLINKMQPKNTENPIGLIAGPKSISAAITVPPVKNPTVFQKGDPFYDPWQGTAASSSVGKVESGPTEKYLQQHDQQIKHLENRQSKSCRLWLRIMPKIKMRNSRRLKRRCKPKQIKHRQFCIALSPVWHRLCHSKRLKSHRQWMS